MRPDYRELRMMISSLDPHLYTKYDHGVIKFAMENKVIPEISPLSLEFADISAQCNMIGFENYISYSIANIIENSQYDINCLYEVIGIVSSDNGISCSVVVRDLSLRDKIISPPNKTLNDYIKEMKNILGKCYVINEDMQLKDINDSFKKIIMYIPVDLDIAFNSMIPFKEKTNSNIIEYKKWKILFK